LKLGIWKVISIGVSFYELTGALFVYFSFKPLNSGSSYLVM